MMLIIISCRKSIELTQYINKKEEINLSLYENCERMKVLVIPTESDLWNEIFKWAETRKNLKGGNSSYTTYLPDCVIQGDKFKINFQTVNTIVSIRNEKNKNFIF